MDLPAASSGVSAGHEAFDSIDDQVKVVGKMPTKEQVKQWLT